MSRGITGFGAYIPRARLQRAVIAEAHAWFDASLKSLGRGRRSMCNWDEDTITMGVEAAADCLAGLDGFAPENLFFASTTFPFLDRQNSVVLAEALDLPRQMLAMDASASQRAATSALLALLQGERAGMVVASEHRRAKAGSRAEMLWGDAAAAVATGGGPVLAEFVGGESLATDFVDHYRGGEFDYDWEERWIRDEGYLKIVPETVNRLLEKSGAGAGTSRISSCRPTRRARRRRWRNGWASTLAPLSTTRPRPSVSRERRNRCCCSRKRSSRPIPAISYCSPHSDKAATPCCSARPRRSAASSPPPAFPERSPRAARKRVTPSSSRSTTWVERDIGKRGETDKQTYLSGYNRRRDLVTSFAGGKCRECGAVQIPREKYCVDPECNALDSQDSYSFADKRGTVLTWTADRLTFDWSPPAYFGMVQFDGGGKLMMDFTEVREGAIDSGSRISVHFRVRPV